MSSSSEEDSDVDVIERVICNIPEVFVYKIPPASTSEGYYASGWKKVIWTGPLRIISKGKECRVEFFHKADGDIFATCYIEDDPPSVEPVKDSSRYFALRIVNERGKKAYIGIGFQQRSDAFDFNVTIQDHKKQAEEDEGDEEAEEEEEEDFSLAKNQKINISVNIKGSGGGKERGPSSIKAVGGVLAPPPAASGRSRVKGGGRRAPAAKPKKVAKRRKEESDDDEEEEEEEDWSFM